MARIEWVKQALDNWALWAERNRAGGLGYARQSAFLACVVDRDHEVILPVDEVDASVMDKAVGALKVPAPHLFQTLMLYYIKGVGIKGTARALGRAESTVACNLGMADVKLAQWYTDRKAAQDTRRNAL